MHFSQFKTGIVFAALLMKAAVGYTSVAQICEAERCQPITYFEHQTVMEKLTAMFKNNTKQILLCAADSSSKKCLNQPLTFNGQTSMMYVDFQVPFIRVLQKERLENALELALDYQVRANDKYPACSVSVSQFTLFPKGEIILTSPSFECRATELGNTYLAFQFKIDYINFETGWLGASYEVRSSGDVLAQENGYVMMRVSSERSIALKQQRFNRNADMDYWENFESDSSSGKLLNWDWDNIKTKWNNFKEKFMKILYLEPLE